MSGRLAGSPQFLAALRARLAPFRRTIGTTGGLVVATAINSATGFIFWWIAARQYPEAAVGLAGAAVSAMLFLSQISVLGLGTSLAGVLHREPRKASLAVTALLAAAATGMLLGGVFAVASPVFAQELGPIASSLLIVLLFAGGVSLTALSSVLDQVLVAVLHGSYQLLRNTIFSISRLGLVVAAGVILAPDAMTIYGVWVLSMVMSLAALAVLPRPPSLVGAVRPLIWRRLGDMASSALSHHILNLGRSSSIWLLPVLVTVVLSSEVNAAFYMALLLANFIALIGTSATFTLYVVGARAPEQLWHQVRFTLGLSLLAAVLGTVVLTIGGRPLLSAFGPSYAETAFPTVAILAVSTVPLAIKDHWIAVQRLRGGVARAAVIGIGTLALELGGGVVGAMQSGLVGLAVARFTVLAIEAVAMAPTVYRALFPPNDGGMLPPTAGPSDIPELVA